MVGGVGIIGLSLVLIGPTPFIPFLENNLWWNIICLTIHGIGAAFAIVPSISYFTDEALALGYEDDVSVYSLVSGMWQCCFSLGEVIGPIAGAALADYYGFPWQSTLVGIFCISVALLTTLFYLTCGKPKSKRSVNGTSETAPLLPDGSTSVQ